jgi:hypothetical protein
MVLASGEVDCEKVKKPCPGMLTSKMLVGKVVPLLVERIRPAPFCAA